MNYYLLAALLVSAGLFLYYQNNVLSLTEISAAFAHKNGIRIIHLSDLHNKRMPALIKKIKALNPDMILFTGDFIYKRRKGFQNAVRFIKESMDIAPAYFILGNHDTETKKNPGIIEILRETGCNLLINQTSSLNIRGLDICLLGLCESLSDDIQINEMLRDFERVSGFKILLTHYSNLFAYNGEYKNYDIHMVFSGHAHGGQFILPLVGGVYAPQQGLFPKYFRGLHIENDTRLIISRGLGKSLFPFRLFNRPEITVVTI